jgi:hypothetical protein
MIDPNRSIYSTYQTLIENQFLHFLKFFAIFLGKEKLLHLRILDRPIMMIFFLPNKIAKKKN